MRLAPVAPELRDGKRAPDERSDVWSLGALLYETLTGRAPEADGKRVPLDERAPHLPADIVALVERCLAAAPAARALADTLPGDEAARAAAEPTTVAAGTLETTASDVIAFPMVDEEPAAPAPDAQAPPAGGEPTSALAPAPEPATEVDDGPEITLEASPSAAPAAPPKDAPQPEPPSSRKATTTAKPKSKPKAKAGDAKPGPDGAAARPAAEIKTLSDVAAAFGPIEGSDRIERASAPKVAAQVEAKADKGDKREASANALLGVALVLLYSGGFFGSYRVVASSLLNREQDPKRAALAELEREAAKRKRSKAGASALAGQRPAEESEAADGEDELRQRSEAGGSERDDMRAIEEMDQSRKRKSAQFEQLHEIMR